MYYYLGSMVKHGELPIIQPSISCERCNGACCHAGTILELTDPEHAMMVAEYAKNGAVDGTLRRTDRPTRTELEQMLGGISFFTDALENPQYALLSDCPFLVRGDDKRMAQCGIHGQLDQPQVCRDFQAGSPGCLEMRAARFPGAEPPANE